jgi:hypothetical protein
MVFCCTCSRRQVAQPGRRGAFASADLLSYAVRLVISRIASSTSAASDHKPLSEAGVEGFKATGSVMIVAPANTLAGGTARVYRAGR